MRDESLIHIAQYITGTGTDTKTYKYESMKIRARDFKQKVYESVQNTFKTKYWDTHCRNGSSAPSSSHNVTETGARRPENSSFKDFVDYLKSQHPQAHPDEVASNDPDGFVKHIYYDFDVIKRYIVLKNNEITIDIDDIKRRLLNLECYFYEKMVLTTTKLNNRNQVEVTHESVNHTPTVDDHYCQMEIKDGNKISNEWTCPATGNLVIYGWLDSTNALNNKAVPSAFCVIEGNINGTTDKPVWEIISVQPVTPAKSITYVGFNLLVKKGLMIRARTGFTVGAKSSQFSNENDGYDTLSNDTANGFKCMIYSNEKYTGT